MLIKINKILKNKQRKKKKSVIYITSPTWSSLLMPLASCLREPQSDCMALNLALTLPTCELG